MKMPQASQQLASSAVTPPRRVVTGLDAQGRSCVLFDGPSQKVIWSTAEAPADNSGAKDAGEAAISFPDAGSKFMYTDFPPGLFAPMHTTDSIDYFVIAAGEVTIITETGQTILRAGDVFVDRGIAHAWRNHSDQTCRIIGVLCPAHPVG